MSAATKSVEREIEELFARYCECIDQRSLESLADVFTRDCRVRFGEEQVEGFDALLHFLHQGLARFAETKHVVSDVELEPEQPGRLRSVARIEAWHRFVKDRPDLTIFGRYRSVFVETEAGWRIAEHEGSESRREPGLDPPEGAGRTT